MIIFLIILGIIIGIIFIFGGIFMLNVLFTILSYILPPIVAIAAIIYVLYLIFRKED